MRNDWAGIGRAYDQVADRYDDLLDRDAWMRRLIWRRYRHAFRPGDRVLDLGCGTGIDSLYLVRLGMRVTAVDASREMLQRLRHKLDRRGRDRIEVRQGDLNRLQDFDSASYAGIVSSFSALNTVHDWAAWGEQAHRVLRPGGRLIVHALNSGDIWEGAAKRAQQRRTIVVCGHPVDHHCPPARLLYRDYLAAHFRPRFRCGLSFVLPYGWRYRLPGVLNKAIGELEYGLGRLPGIMDWGRFYLMDLERR